MRRLNSSLKLCALRHRGPKLASRFGKFGADTAGHELDFLRNQVRPFRENQQSRSGFTRLGRLHLRIKRDHAHVFRHFAGRRGHAGRHVPK